MLNLCCKTLLLSLCVSHLLALGDGHALRRRTVSEVQLMHNLGEHKQVQERREWLQRRLQGVHSTGPSGGGGGGEDDGGPGWARKGPAFQELPGLADLTPEDIQRALGVLERLLKSRQ